MRRVLLDTETTGITTGRVIQLSYIVLNKDNLFQYARNYYFYVDPSEMTAETTNIHGIDHAKLEVLSRGLCFEDYIGRIKKDLDWSWFIAQNAEFDYKFLTWEFAACGQFFVPARVFCTKLYMANILKLPPNPGYADYKWPSIGEITAYFGISKEQAIQTCKEIFNTDEAGQHDARYDVSLLYLCYQAMIKHKGGC